MNPSFQLILALSPSTVEEGSSSWLVFTTPWQSGSVDHEQGVGKAGNPRLRTVMTQLAWLWLHHQPNSALSTWFMERVQRNGGRGKKTAIVALGRKLLVALWKFAVHGVVIEGAKLKAA